jgi:hypothetical protein
MKNKHLFSVFITLALLLAVGFTVREVDATTAVNARYSSSEIGRAFFQGCRSSFSSFWVFWGLS